MERTTRRPVINYHTHTWRCQHAQGTERQFVEHAIDAGFSVLGFADHTPWPYKSDFISGMRMRWDQFEDYRATILSLQKEYAGRISIPLGLECEAFPEYESWLRDLKAECLDYVILGNHYDYTDEFDHGRLYPEGSFYFGRCTRPEHIARYAERTIHGMGTGLFDYVAHPDLFMHTYPAFDDECRAVSRDLCQAAKQYDLPLEFNLLGLYRSEAERLKGWQCYPCPGFWEIAARTGCKAIVGFDAHFPEFVDRVDLFDRAHEYLEGLGMEIVPCLPGIGV